MGTLARNGLTEISELFLALSLDLCVFTQNHFFEDIAQKFTSSHFFAEIQLEFELVDAFYSHCQVSKKNQR